MDIKELRDYLTKRFHRLATENFISRSDQRVEVYNVIDDLEKLFITERDKQTVLFAEWLQYNGKYQLPKEQVKSFLEKK